MAEIRPSFADERLHLEHEVIALIEVAFITLTYMLKIRRGRPPYLHKALGVRGRRWGGERLFIPLRKLHAGFNNRHH